MRSYTGISGEEEHGTAIAGVIDSSTGGIANLPDLLIAREEAGLIRYQDWVYVFGGYATGDCMDKRGADLKSAEAISLPRLEAWTALPKMHKRRRRLTPCLWQAIIYLCGGDNNSMEGFKCAQNIYFLLPILLPEENNASLCVINDHLVVFSTFFVSKISKTASDHTLTSKRHERVASLSLCPPVFWHNLIFLMQIDKFTTLDADLGIPPPFPSKKH